MQKFRSLSNQEIDVLASQNCKCEDWELIKVANEFDPKYVQNVTFSGDITLGFFNQRIEFIGGIKKHTGIYNAILHNCSVGNNSLINNIKNYIANYKIGANVVIENTELIAVEKKTTFGNNTTVDVMDETGGRKIPIYDKLSAHTAYILAFYKHQPELISKIEGMILAYSKTKYSSTGYIGDNSKIFNCKQIRNVWIGESSIITGASRLKNGTINSNSSSPVEVGPGVVADNFIISSGSEVSDGAVISNCFVGQGCILSKHYSAIHSLFFSNCQGFNGEACSIFAGPFTVTHHKSTLLIAGMFSFLNAGSGSNQSNHMYKLGPIHHGIIERGSKTTSDSYILWPAKIGAFTLVMGRHYKNSDTTNLPFSYLIENKDESWLVPAINLQSVGTIRDAMKWPRRDNRKDPVLLDHVNYNLLSPYSIQRMINGQELLLNLKKYSGNSTETYNWQTTLISKSSLERGIKLYELAITKFLGNSVISKLLQCKNLKTLHDVRLCLEPTDNDGSGDWIDLAGLIAPKNLVSKMISEIEANKISTLDQIEHYFKNLYINYYNYEWTWAANIFENRVGKPIKEIKIDDLVQLIMDWIKSVVTLDEYLYNDAKKEFTLSAKTGFGIDGDEKTKEQDFESVRGTFEKNTFVTEILDHIKRKTKLGNQTIEMLQKIEE